MGRTSDARERLVQSAAQLLHEGGYQSVGVDELCRHAGVKKGSFYYFFPSKEALALAAMDAQGRGFEAQLIGPSLRSAAPPLERIRRFFELVAEGVRQHKAQSGCVLGCPVGNLAAEVSSTEHAILKRADSVLQRIAREFASVLREGRASGALPDIDPEANAQALLAYFEGCMLLAKVRNDAALLGELVPGAVALAATPRAARPAAAARRRTVSARR